MNSRIYNICHRFTSHYLYIAVVITCLQFNWFTPLVNSRDSIYNLKSTAVAVFPSSLQSIGEEAFADTSVQHIIFNNELALIGEKAFYKTKALKNVYIPDSVSFIANDAFKESTLSVIYGIKNSIAQKWAEGQGVSFIPKDIWSAIKDNSSSNNSLLLTLLSLAFSNDDKRLNGLKRRLLLFMRSMRPQDRIELYPINYRFP